MGRSRLDTYLVFLLIKHEWGNGPTLVGMGPGLSADTDGRTANTKMVNGAGDSMRRRRHCVEVMWKGITKVVDGE